MSLTRARLAAFSLLALSFVSLTFGQVADRDSDSDGISDRDEQALLERFRPKIMVSPTDCAVRPARFQAGVPDPVKPEADGTIYGQVFPAGDGRVEIHYHTLWSRDCGRRGHPFDVEHISVLVSRSGSEPRALYWYAGAHEKTACDISSGARAANVDGEASGITVWSSAGKHAMYMSENMCNHGCGADTCAGEAELPRQGAVVNLGEREHPMNDALWVRSTRWPLGEKMGSDFDAETTARLNELPPNEIVTLRGRSTVRGVIQGSGAVVNGAEVGKQHTENALGTANGHTSRSLGKAMRATGRSLKKTWNAVFGEHPEQKK